MPSPSINVRLASFSPSSDFFALASGDGRIKIWDTTRGNLQTELSNFTVTATTVSRDTGILPEPEGGHLSVDYTCMKWVQIGGKRKKPGRSILVLGTGSGDVLGIDVAAGQLKWKLSDCHPGGASAVSFSTHGSCIYTAGADGIICRIDPSGNLLNKFRSSTKTISSLSISADGKLLAAASAQIKVFSCSDNKKIQKFSGHTVGVQCMIFSEDGRYILSSAVGEKYVAIWKMGAGTKQSACCVLPMEHPAVSLDSMGSDGKGADSAGLYVSALSEKGRCYFWYAGSMEELHSSKPTRISSIQPSLSKSSKGLAIYAAKLQGIVTRASGAMLVAYGSLIKPSFEKIVVDYGVDLKLNAPQEVLLVPGHQFNISRKGQAIQNTATALDRANAEDAVHPLPKLHGYDNKRKHGRLNSVADVDDAMVDPIVNRQNKSFGQQEAHRRASTVPDGFNADYLKVYYGKLFPYGDIFKWMSYGNDGKHPACDPSYFGRREFSFTLENYMYLRFQSFNNATELESSIKEKCPFKIDIGPVYNVDPAKKQAYAKGGSNVFTPVERELIFDIDMSDYDDVRYCCSGADICLECWHLMTVAIKLMDTALRDDFGFNHILWVYSGRRGVHCWVCDGRARRLGNEQRASIADYFRLYKGGENGLKKVSLIGPVLHPFLAGSYTDVLKIFFEEKLLCSQKLLSSEDRYKKILELIPDQSVSAELHDKWQGNQRFSSSKDPNIVRWEQLKHVLGKQKTQGLHRCVEEIVFSYTYLRLDMEVSKHMNHLLKAPFCIHPKTGRVCVPIDPNNCDDFDPTTVPTLSQLLEELNIAGMREFDNEWEGTSLGKHIRFFRSSFLQPLLKACKEEMEVSYNAKLQQSKNVMSW